MFDKDLIFLSLILVLLSLAPCFAMDLQHHEFNSNFKMDVPVNSSFDEVPILIDPNPYGTIIYGDGVNNINVTFFAHCNDKTFVEDAIIDLVDNYGFKLEKEGNMHLLSNGSQEIVVFDKDDKVVVISSSDRNHDTLKAMANSIEI